MMLLLVALLLHVVVPLVMMEENESIKHPLESFIANALITYVLVGWVYAVLVEWWMIIPWVGAILFALYAVGVAARG